MDNLNQRQKLVDYENYVDTISFVNFTTGNDRIMPLYISSLQYSPKRNYVVKYYMAHNFFDPNETKK